jgi:hypothetical protein
MRELEKKSEDPSQVEWTTIHSERNGKTETAALSLLLTEWTTHS